MSAQLFARPVRWLPRGLMTSGLSTGSAHLAAAVATVALGAAHALVPALRDWLGDREGIAAAVGGGVASAYVFLHLLPEIARGNEEIAEVLGETAAPTLVAEVLLFAVAFAGFLSLYALDHIASSGQHPERIFAVHVGAFALYNAVITYTLPSRFEAGWPTALLFTVAMAVHFLLSDRNLSEHHRGKFHRIGRPVLVGALAAGFLLAVVVAPTRTTVVSVMIAALGGFVLFNVFSDELPSERRVRLPAFLLSACIYAALLVAVTIIEA